MSDPRLQDALAHYPEAIWRGVAATTITVGLINATWRVGEHVLQRLHTIFDARVNEDIAALLPVLRAAGVPVPELVRTTAGAVDVSLEDGSVWRLLTRLPGQSITTVTADAQAVAAAKALAAFHGALRDVTRPFSFGRLGIHDTEAHMAGLEASLAESRSHRLYDHVAAAAATVRALWAAWGSAPAAPTRIGHGDPKISNFLFGDAGQITGVVDLDTMGPTTLDVELGDALRSWCNPAPEDAPRAASFDVARAVAAITAYVEAARPWIADDEIDALARGPQRIALELAARFLKDALDERYFGWDPSRYERAGAHHLERGLGQLRLAEDIFRQQDSLRYCVDGLGASRS